MSGGSADKENTKPCLVTRKGPREKGHPVRLYLERVSSVDLQEFPEFDPTPVEKTKNGKLLLESGRVKALKGLSQSQHVNSFNHNYALELRIHSKPLPKLPVPRLDDTLDKYLLCIKPIVPAEQYEKTEKLVQEFRKAGGQGEMLQRHLLQYAETKDNWVYDFWLYDMYMRVRLSLPINSNPGMVFPRQNFADQNAQLRYAARFVSGILDYKVIIDSRLLPCDRARSRERGQPLCMEQYYRLFTSYRYPGVDRDQLVSMVTSPNNGSELADSQPESILVACKNQFFLLEVVSDGFRLSDDVIYAQLKRIVKEAGEGRAGPGVGILTAASRDRWARAREKLCSIDEINRASLASLERCIFVLCLDEGAGTGFNHPESADLTARGERDDVNLALQTIHGQGSACNSANRWFDKTIQFIIAEDGACGLCYEHSTAEGIAVVQLIEHLLTYMEELRLKKLPRMESLCELKEPRKLEWVLDDQIKQEIVKVSEDFDRTIQDLDLHVLRFKDYGKNFPKSQNMSPDAFIQLALQLAYYRVHGCLVSTYESASIRRFRFGRVDNIRACSIEALEWCQVMTDSSTLQAKEKMGLLRKAIKKQTDILVQAILGYGIDNHLLGLKRTAEEVLGMETPELFLDESYQTSNHFTLSTSQVPTTMDAFMCYGPVVPDGYGACYNPHEDYILVCVSSFRSWGGTSSSHFSHTLEQVFRDIKNLCLSASTAPANNSNK